MLVKTHDLQDYLTDASFIRDGHAERVVLPETIDEVAQVLAEANRARTPVTVSGAGTGTVGGRVAFGGIVLATDRLNHIKSIVREDGAARIRPSSKRSRASGCGRPCST